MSTGGAPRDCNVGLGKNPSGRAFRSISVATHPLSSIGGATGASGAEPQLVPRTGPTPAEHGQTRAPRPQPAYPSPPSTERPRARWMFAPQQGPAGSAGPGLAAGPCPAGSPSSRTGPGGAPRSPDGARTQPGSGDAPGRSTAPRPPVSCS